MSVHGTNRDTTYTVLGAGLAGLSASFHLGHDRCELFEAKPHHGGHLYSESVDGFTWDEGPHISFTKSEYVRELFAESVDGRYVEFANRMANYYRGHWIDHPAQVNLYQVPEPLRSECLQSFLDSRPAAEAAGAPRHYGEWLHQAFGPVFAEHFPAVYTRKYWTTEPDNLDTDWVGSRVHAPDVDEVVAGAAGPPATQPHYFSSCRYPAVGGFAAFLRRVAEGARIHYRREACGVHLADRRVDLTDGTSVPFDRLVSTLPLPILIGITADAPDEVREAADRLRCSSLLLVNVTARHPTARPEHWLYVYDADKYATRITFTERLAPSNAPPGTTGIQVEVYGSPYRPLPEDHGAVARAVVAELIEMGLVEDEASLLDARTRLVPWANVIFDRARKEALGVVDGWLDHVGVLRAGRYAEWKYLWTDGCVLSGRALAEREAAGAGITPAAASRTSR